MRILGLLIGLAVLCSSTDAGIILTVGTNSITPGAGPVLVDVFVRSDANDSSQALEVFFQLPDGGRFSPNPGAFGTGFFGAGNLDASSGFITANPFTTSVLNLDFNNSQLFPSTDARIAQISIDTTGLAVGTYRIVPSGLFTEATINNVVAGSFIVAVPEPTSIALLSVVVGGLCGRRLIKRRKAKAIA